MWKSILVLSCVISCALCKYEMNRNSMRRYEVNPIPMRKYDGPVAPFWQMERQSLYFVNSINVGWSEPSVFRYSYNEGVLYSAYLPGIATLSFIIPVKNATDNHLFLVGTENNGQIIRWDGESRDASIVEDTFAFNGPSTVSIHGSVSPTGQFYGGSFSTFYCRNKSNLAPYSVYRYDNVKGLINSMNGVATVGIAFNSKTRKMYHLAPCHSLITECDWDEKTGEIRNKHVVFDFNAAGIDTSGIKAPFGLTIDNRGLLYTVTQLGAVLVIDPRQRAIVETINLPVLGASGLIFGGPDNDILFVVNSKKIRNFDTAQIERTVLEGSPLYTITGTGARTSLESAKQLEIQLSPE